MAVISNPDQNYDVSLAEGTHYPFTITDPKVSGIQTLVEWTTFGGTAENVVDFSVTPASASNLIPVASGGSLVIDLFAIADGLAESAEDFRFSYTIQLQGLGNTILQKTNVHVVIPANTADVVAALPTTPANADLKSNGSGTAVSGSYHTNADASWYVDDRTAAAGDDQSFFRGTGLSTLIDAASKVPARYLVTKSFTDLANAPQRAHDFFEMEYRHQKILFDLHVARPLSGDLFDGSVELAGVRDGALEAEMARYRADKAAYLVKYNEVAAAAAVEALSSDEVVRVNSTTNSFSIGIVDRGAPVTGTARSDEIIGGVSSDVIRPGRGTDYVNAGAGNDRVYLSADGSADYINGGAGLDAVTYDGPRANFVVSFSAGRITVKEPSGPNDTLVNVERVQFSDSVLAFDIQESAGSAYRMYQAAFNRTPDKGGVSFWTSVLDRGNSLDVVAQGFVKADEFKGVYGTNPSNSKVVDLFYQNVLGRPGETEGRNFWIGTLDAGASVATVLKGFANSPENHARVDPVIAQGIALDQTAFLA